MRSSSWCSSGSLAFSSAALRSLSSCAVRRLALRVGIPQRGQAEQHCAHVVAAPRFGRGLAEFPAKAQRHRLHHAAQLALAVEHAGAHIHQGDALVQIRAARELRLDEIVGVAVAATE
jgi:hypothetical protein